MSGWLGAADLEAQRAPRLGDSGVTVGRRPGFIHVFGPYNSGTCLMFNYPHELTDVPMQYHDAFWKHSLPPFFRWGPGCEWAEEQGRPSSGLLSDRLLIAMVRNPYFWIASTLRHGYEIGFPDAVGGDADGRLRSTVSFLGQMFSSLAELWNSYYRAYERYLSHHRLVYVRLEDIVADPRGMVGQLARHHPIRSDLDVEAVVERLWSTPAKVRLEPCPAGAQAADAYRVGRVGGVLTAAQLELINADLDPDLMAWFGYPRVA